MHWHGTLPATALAEELGGRFCCCSVGPHITPAKHFPENRSQLLQRLIGTWHPFFTLQFLLLLRYLCILLPQHLWPDPHLPNSAVFSQGADGPRPHHSTQRTRRWDASRYPKELMWLRPIVEIVTGFNWGQWWDLAFQILRENLT